MDQEFEDLKEFLHMIDFEQVGDQIHIVENYFKLEDFPATVQNYIKKYFGSARCFEKGGALTIIATSSCATGNPVDDMISSEISSLANFETTLNGELVMKRSFPALDLQKTYRKTTGQIQSLEEQEIEEFVRSEYLFTHNAELLLRVLRGSDTFLEFEKNIRK